MNVVFLDYDGVVNIAMWNKEGTRCFFNIPEDDKVNHFQAVQWVSKFCQKFDYKIVVTSTWRRWSNYQDCLINGGLRDGIEILGKTDEIFDGSRGDEIQKYLDEHPEIENYLIFDDEYDFNEEQKEHLVQCDIDVGFNLERYNVASRLNNYFQNKRLAGGETDE